MKTKKMKRVLLAMNILVAVVFIGLFVKTAAILYSFFVSLFINSEASKNLYLGLDLSNLFEFNKAYYILMVLIIASIPGLKAYLFYLIVKVFSRLNLVHPFSITIAGFIKRMSYVALLIGILAFTGFWFSNWLNEEGALMITAYQYVSGGAEFLFFAGIIFTISLIFRKGIEMQTENELTI